MSAAAKSLPSVLCADKSPDAPPPVCAGEFMGWVRLMRGTRGITGMAFIRVETASDVPSAMPPAYNPMMKITPVNARSAPQASGGYSQGIEIFGAQRLLFISGQIPESVRGEVPGEFAEQAKLAWNNLLAQLDEAAMSVKNLVKVTIYLSSRDFAAANREIRQKVLGAHSPAMTVIITGIFDEKWLLEIEATAAA